jgi:hypothetical protein
VSGLGVDRLARRMLHEARTLDVPTMPDPDEPPPSPVDFAKACGFEPDTWQADVLTSPARKRLLCCTRQGGKSTTTAIGALYEAVYEPGSLALLLSPSQRQSGELFRKVMQLYHACSLPLPTISAESVLRLELDNGSRVIALPGSESTTRGYSAATLVVIDEAARVPDPLIAAVRPTLATTNGRLIALTTPQGKRGWFHEQWTKGVGWERTLVTASECPRISAEFLEDERRELGEFVYTQEYECQFLDAETAVFSSDLIAAALSGGFEPLWPVGSPAWTL